MAEKDISTPFLQTEVGKELSEIYSAQPSGEIFGFLLQLT
jgi:hypothetical protein